MARNYRELRQQAGGNIVYNPVEAAVERRSSSGGRDYRALREAQRQRDTELERQQAERIQLSQANAMMQVQKPSNVFSSIQNFQAVHPQAEKSKGVASAMADTLGGVLDGITFGVSKPLTDRIRDYVSDENDATKVSQSRRNEIESRHGALIGETIGSFGSGAGAFRVASKAIAPLTRSLPGIVERGVAPLASRLGPTAGALTRVGAQKVGQGLGMAATGAAAGALFQAPREVTEAAYGVNNQSLGERAKDVGLSAAFGAVLDPFVEIYGGAVGKALSKFFGKGKAETTTVEPSRPSKGNDPLALPIGRNPLDTPTLPGPRYDTPQLNAPRQRGNINRAETPDVIVNPHTFELNAPRGGTGAVSETVAPPYGNIDELASWIQKHLGAENVSLDDVRKLPYEDMTKIADEMQRRLNGVENPVAAPQTVPAFNGETQTRINEDSLPKKVDPVPEQPVKRKYERPNYSAAVGTREEISPAQPKPLDASDLPSNPPDIEDVADDIELPQSDEVAPRVRERVSNFADDLINSAKEELARSRNRLSSNPIDVYAQYAKIGAGYMLKGSVKLADFTEQLVKDFGENIRPHAKAIFKQAKEQYKQVQRQIETEELGVDFDATKLKDLSNINLNTADVYRNFRKVFGDKFESVKKAILDPFDNAKGAYAQEQKDMADKLYQVIVKGLGIRKGSKESALVQKFGEKQITLEELKQQSPQKWQKIVQADQWFRQQYDDLIDRVNESVSRIYPNRPEKLVPKRDDYYRHFQELNAWSGLKNLFDTTSGKISPSLAGLSPHTQPKTKWASFKQKRGMGEFKNDAVGGFLDYIPAASYAIHIDPQIAVFRNLAKRLAQDTDKTANVNNFIKFLNNFANDLSGKTSPIDRWVEEIGGRKALMAITKLNNRVKANTILGNAGSLVAQIANIPNGLAYAGVDAVPGLMRTAASLFSPNQAMAKSAFLRERYLDQSFRKFDQKWWEQPKRFAEAAMEIADRIGTSITWNSAYAKGVRQKVDDPVKFADAQSRRLLGGRGVGEQPLLIKSKVFNIMAPFQLEVNNQWRVMKDFVDSKSFGGLATLLVYNWIFNKAAEAIRGSSVTFDPIDAIYEAVTEDDINILQRTGRVAGEMLSNLPLGQNLAAMYPEYGTNLYGVQLPSREGLFGDKDPTRFGEGLVLTKGIQDPIFKLALPWGGNQLKKSIQGLDALIRGGSYTDNILTTGTNIENPSLRFPVDSTPVDAARSVLFGPYATSQGKEYTGQERRPLTTKQTASYLKSKDSQRFYDDLMAKRKADAEKAKNVKLKQEQKR